MITKYEINVINQTYSDIKHIAVLKGFDFAVDELLKQKKAEEKLHRGWGDDWQKYHDIKAKELIMAKYQIAEALIKGALTKVIQSGDFISFKEIESQMFTPYQMLTANAYNRAKALGMMKTQDLKDGLDAELIGKFRELNYSEMVAKEVELFSK